jgi:phosphoribulokinase
MSLRHPIIAVTGSSGAGTTKVTRTFSIVANAKPLAVSFYHQYGFEQMSDLPKPRIPQI